MPSRLLTTTTEVSKVFEEWCARADDIRIVTAWATTECTAFSKLKAARNTISTLVVGLDFYTTSPSFKERLRPSLRIGKAPGRATFHPKIYLFKRGHSYCCLMGSSNFTSGGFGDNVESNVCITGNEPDAFFSQISTFINEQEQQSKEISSPEIADYRRQSKKFAAGRSKPGKLDPKLHECSASADYHSKPSLATGPFCSGFWKCPWWRTPQPSGSLERRIWKTRVAIVDAIYYQLGG